MATVRPGRCPVRGVRVRGRLGFGAGAANPTPNRYLFRNLMINGMFPLRSPPLNATVSYFGTIFRTAPMPQNTRRSDTITEQQRLAAMPDFRPYSIKADAGLVQARRIITRLLQSESNAA